MFAYMYATTAQQTNTITMKVTEIGRMAAAEQGVVRSKLNGEILARSLSAMLLVAFRGDLQSLNLSALQSPISDFPVLQASTISTEYCYSQPQKAPISLQLVLPVIF